MSAPYFPTVQDLLPLPITARAEIPTSYLDEMGHMNVMWYTHLFSRSVWGFFQTFGFTHEYMLAHHAGSFALELHVRYLNEVKAGQHVTLRARAVARTAKRIHYLHFMTIDERDDVLSAVGEIVSAHVDMNVRRQSPFPPELTEPFDKMLAEHTALPWPAPVCGTMRA